MLRIIWLLVLCLMFIGCGARAFADINDNQAALAIRLKTLFREPMASRIYDWAEFEEKPGTMSLTGYAWLKNARCESNLPNDCLVNHYLNEYLKTRKDTTLDFEDYLFLALGAYTLSLQAGTIFLARMTNAISKVYLSEIFLISLIVANASALHIHIRESIREQRNQKIINNLLKAARNDYLQIILALLEKSLADFTGGNVEKSFKNAELIKIDSSRKKTPITLHALASYTRSNFSSKGRQLVMLDKKMKLTGFFHVFVRAPYSGGMQIILETRCKYGSDMHYMLKASHFDLVPLLVLLRMAGVKYVQLVDIQRNTDWED